MDESNKSKIRIKLGKMEIEFEGSEAFLEHHLPNLIELLASVGPADFEDEGIENEEELLDTSPRPEEHKARPYYEHHRKQIGCKEWKGPRRGSLCTSPPRKGP